MFSGGWGNDTLSDSAGTTDTLNFSAIDVPLQTTVSSSGVEIKDGGFSLGGVTLPHDHQHAHIVG